MRFLRNIVRALLSGRHRPRPRPRPSHVSKPALSDEEFLRQMRALAASSNGAVQVIEHSGGRTTPNELTFTPMVTPGTLQFFKPFISAQVSIDHIVYGFHAYVHPRANSYSDPWMYYAVTGPSNDRSAGDGEFGITNLFKWTGDRPMNPLLVKAALREWTARPEVVEATRRARRTLRKPLKKTAS